MSEKGNSTKKGIAIAKPARTVNKRKFIDGSTRSHVILNTAAIGEGTYKPGWQWSLYAGPLVGEPSTIPKLTG
jgi:hypothetical protein